MCHSHVISMALMSKNDCHGNSERRDNCKEENVGRWSHWLTTSCIYLFSRDVIESPNGKRAQSMPSDLDDGHWRGRENVKEIGNSLRKEQIKLQNSKHW